jgi:hypothetical protein
MAAQSTRGAWLTSFLWINVFAWSVAFGGKLFELMVVIPSWAADPPSSLSLMPYGPRYPFNPGDFYQPLGVVALVGCVGSLLCGWRTPANYKVLLWVPFAVLLVTAAVTPTLFWPMITALYRAGTGTAPLSDAAVDALLNKWLWYDWLRGALGVPALVCAVQALRMKDRALVA